MERLLVGFDGSPASVSALSWAAERAARGPGTVQVTLTTALSRTTPDRADILRLLGDAEGYVRDRAPGTSVQLAPAAAGVIDSLVNPDEPSDLVVVGITPGHPVRALISGAIPLRVSTRSSVPVVMVPAGWVDVGDPVTVGVGSDGSSAGALRFGAAEAVAGDRPLRLVHAWLMPTPVFAGPTARMASPESIVREHRMTLDAAVRTCAHQYRRLEVRPELIRETAATALLAHAPDSSMIVIGTHRRGVLAGSLWGSVAQDVLWRAQCPVIVAPATAPPGKP